MICDQHSIEAADTFIVFDPEDRHFASVCHSAADTRETIDQFPDASLLRVHRITLGDFARDVTEDFIPSGPEDEDDAAGIPHPDDLRGWYEGRVL